MFKKGPAITDSDSYSQGSCPSTIAVFHTEESMRLSLNSKSNKDIQSSDKMPLMDD